NCDATTTRREVPPLLNPCCLKPDSLLFVKDDSRPKFARRRLRPCTVRPRAILFARHETVGPQAQEARLSRGNGRHANRGQGPQDGEQADARTAPRIFPPSDGPDLWRPTQN